MGDPKNGWFTVDIYKWMIWPDLGVPLFQETKICVESMDPVLSLAYTVSCIVSASDLQKCQPVLADHPPDQQRPCHELGVERLVSTLK